MNDLDTTRHINIDFLDFGHGNAKEDFNFFKLLRERFPVRVADDPDFLIYSHKSNLHRLYTCKKIYWTSEVYAPDWRECDYAMTHHLLDEPTDQPTKPAKEYLSPAHSRLNSRKANMGQK